MPLSRSQKWSTYNASMQQRQVPSAESSIYIVNVISLGLAGKLPGTTACRLLSLQGVTLASERPSIEAANICVWPIAFSSHSVEISKYLRKLDMQCVLLNCQAAKFQVVAHRMPASVLTAHAGLTSR